MADAAFFDGLAHSAVGLVGVGAVAIAAVNRDFKYLTEVVANLLLFHIEGAKALDPRCIDEPAIGIEREHLREGGGVHTRVVALRNLGSAQAEVGQQSVNGVLLPTPELPESSVVLPERAARTESSPSLLRADTQEHS